MSAPDLVFNFESFCLARCLCFARTYDLAINDFRCMPLPALSLGSPGQPLRSSNACDFSHKVIIEFLGSWVWVKHLCVCRERQKRMPGIWCHSEKYNSSKNQFEVNEENLNFHELCVYENLNDVSTSPIMVAQTIICCFFFGPRGWQAQSN